MPLSLFSVVWRFLHAGFTAFEIKVSSWNSFSPYFLASIKDIKTLRRCSLNQNKLNFRNCFFDISYQGFKIVIRYLTFTFTWRLSSIQPLILMLGTAGNIYEIRNWKKPKTNLNYLLVLSQQNAFYLIYLTQVNSTVIGFCYENHNCFKYGLHGLGWVG